MHITPEFAGLIAQVYPALLIAVLIEGRLPQPKRRDRWVFGTVYIVRYVSVLGGTISTFQCLLVAGTGNESLLTDWVVTLSAVAMFFSMSFMNGILMGGEHSGLLSLFKKEMKPDVRPIQERADEQSVLG